MKSLIILLSLCFCFTGNAIENKKYYLLNPSEQFNNSTQDSLLFDIQDKINTTFIKSLTTHNNDSFSELNAQLERLYETKKQNLILYWRSYLYYYSSIYYLKQKDKEKAEKEIDKGIHLLEQIQNKNSEDYALLSLMQSFAIQFKGAKAMFISKNVKKNARKAIALDSTNLRAYFAYGSNDFYTPERYGGGRDVESFLQKAISLPSQKTKNEYLPSWGKKEAYQILIKFFIRNEKWEFAKDYSQKGIVAFPKDYSLRQLASELAGKSIRLFFHYTFYFSLLH
ncbi:MAG: hypothetical protein HON19_04330 [Flavobacteriales bacterium]|jgi:hypothetical protein|nr:hypothetical protein [Flavobacteriales bacterium]